MIPETKAFCPRGLGMVPYLMPSGVELAEATIKAIDQIDVLNKAALIYIASKNMGFEPEGMSDAQMQELTETFNLPK
jgi:rhamnulose-1-phosphate aldolase